MEKWVKLLCGTCAFQIRALVPVLATLLQLQLSANAHPGRQPIRQHTWVPATHLGDLDEVYGCWFWSAPDLTVADIWGVLGSKPMDERSFSI